MISIGVVADPRRGDMGKALAEKVGADHLNIDTDARGCTWNHCEAWRALYDVRPSGDSYCLVLEDDAIPVVGFREQVAAALAVAPAPIVSLYLGRGYIEDRYIESMLVRADARKANWIVAPGRILHAVALAVRGDLMESLVENLPTLNHPIDRALTTWARSNGHQVAYSLPSLVEHDDGQSLVSAYKRAERKAWLVGVRDEWCDKMTLMI